jgi:uncharacterized protein (TIGR03435 family)
MRTHHAMLILCVTASMSVSPPPLGRLARVAAASAQTPQAKLAFEVASVKINQSGDRRGSLDFQGPDRFVATNQVLPSLLSFAYKIPPGKLLGAPAWMASTRFDIAAKSEGKTSTDQKVLMLRTLLADRFKLKIREVTEEGTVYALVLARSDSRLGPSLRPTNADCVAQIEARRRGDAPPRPAQKPGAPPDCGGVTAGPPGTYNARGIELSSMALTLGAMSQQTVVDRTGLTGLFDVELRSSLEGLDARVAVADPAASAGGVERPPTIFTALPEQLGLKLERQRGSVQTWVIDSIELPIPD